ncbi:MAG: hypothetical protein JKY22_12400 [Flavobacteriaceae bacterium]|nr:hypothetical protein [Flavobacteriaceae bacterium]
MTNVNPPPQIKLPSAFAKDSEINTYFRHLNRMLLQLWTRTGGASDIIGDAENNFSSINISELFDINKRIGSGMALTIDTSGFTVDISEQTTDQSEV